MKHIYYTLFLGVLTYSGYAQHAIDKVDNRAEWKNYASFTETTYNGILEKDKIHYDLLDGKITSYQILQNSEVEMEVDVLYGRDFVVERETKIYDSSNGNIREVIYKNDSRLDSKNNLIDDGEFNYSKFINGRPQIATSKNYNETTKKGLKKMLTYDEAGRLKLSKSTDEAESSRTIVISTYKYDQCGNMIEKSDRTSVQEIQVKKKRNQPSTSSRPVVEKENFEYEYQGCLWTKKYKVVNDKKELLAERVYE